MRIRKIIKRFWPLAGPIFGPAVLFSKILIKGEALFWGTPSLQFFPWWKYAWDTILAGKIPYWNPLVGMGAPLIANYQSGIFYPPYWIDFGVYLAGGITWMAWAHTFVIIAHLAWAGAGSARLAKELGMGELSQSIAGLSYGMGGYLVSRVGFFSINSAGAWFPWVLLLSHRLVNNKNRKTTLKLAIVFGLLFLAGHAQTAWYITLFSGIWITYLALKRGKVEVEGRKLKIIGKFLVAGLTGAGLAAVQILPTAEYLLLSQRSNEYGFQQAMIYSFWPWRFITLAVPGLFGNPGSGNYWGYGNYWEDALYIGMLPLILAFIMIAKVIIDKKNPGVRRERSFVTFFGLMTLISFIFALGDNTPVFPFLYRYVPTFDMFQAPTRFNIWAQISLSMIAGFAVEQWRKPENKGLYWTRLAAAGAFAVALGAGIALVVVQDLEVTFVPATALAGMWGLFTALLALTRPGSSKKTLSQIWAAAVVLIVTMDLLLAGWNLNPGIDKTFYRTESADLNKGGRYFINNGLEYDLKFNQFFLFDSYNPEREWKEVRKVMLPNFQMIFDQSSANNFDPLVPNRFQVWMDELNRSESDTQIKILKLMGVTRQLKIDQDELASFSKLPGPENEFLDFYTCAVVEDSSEKILRDIFSGEIDLTTKIILEGLTFNKQNQKCEETEFDIRVLDSMGSDLRISAEVSQAGWLLIKQTWYPGWKAEVDGVEAELLRADYLFQAVFLEKGKHIVEVYYQSRTACVGGIMTGVTIFLVLFFLLKIGHNKNMQTIQE